MKQTVLQNDPYMDLNQVPRQDGDDAAMLRDKLSALTKEMNQFAYIITHDLQAPLRMVTGFLELLEKKYADKLDTGAKQYIDYAVKGSVKMRNLIFDLLEYSRLSTVVHEFGDIDLGDVLKDAMEKLETDIRQTSAVINTGDLPVVKGAKKLVELLLKHLLDNAIKFRGEAPPLINIRAVKENRTWKICISDNGLGFDPAFSEKIFIIFRRLQTDEVKYPGTGTGLAICKKITELHGGTIGVESEPGKGSTFCFSLPAS